MRYRLTFGMDIHSHDNIDRQCPASRSDSRHASGAALPTKSPLISWDWKTRGCWERRLIMLLEMACRNSILPLLDPGFDSVGTEVNVRHLAATPLGMEVTFKSEVMKQPHRRDVLGPRTPRAHDVRPDDGGQLDLHRHPGDPARHLTRRSPRSPASSSASRTCAGKWMLTFGLGEMGGAQPLAVTMLGGAALIVDVDPRALAASARQARLPRRRAPPTSTTPSPGSGRRPEAGPSLRRLLSQRRRGLPGARAARRGAGRRVGPDRGARHLGRVHSRSAHTLETAAAFRERDPNGYLSEVRRSIRAGGPRHPRDAAPRVQSVRLWEQLPHPGSRGRGRRRVRHPGLRPGATSARSSRSAAARSVGSR